MKRTSSPRGEGREGLHAAHVDPSGETGRLIWEQENGDSSPTWWDTGHENGGTSIGEVSVDVVTDA